MQKVDCARNTFQNLFVTPQGWILIDSQNMHNLEMGFATPRLLERSSTTVGRAL